ncbi:GNAT family N-acetyltransferase [Photobacterium profundum]|uniref:GNAT family N-acetyltransferase n=2 Tax=Photobacterium TaxID=657 RepID=A0A2T3JJJ1_9GAMM|nr:MULTISPECIES: GNAT family N-acetyltransferase [Photobacterium]EAS44198.1 Histone acetyltransferase HPA2 and related acetyltransferase [Photobacterium profundum 3TCK]PSU49173.1 GNAT family N-acetyltransferase [Photobacterium frigidiphilum]PSV62071.1 GNAT family N-acetyltransferase [Photobacterium profundum]
MNLIVRKVKREDALGIINVLNPIITDGRFSILDTIFSEEEEEQFIENFPERGVFNVALNTEDSRVVGFQNVEPFASYTRAFDHVGIIGTFVDGQYRRQGIASSLFDATFTMAKSLGYEKLFAYVRDDNETALKTYLKQGFEIVGKAKKHAKINGKYIDEVLIEKFL